MTVSTDYTISFTWVPAELESLILDKDLRLEIWVPSLGGYYDVLGQYYFTSEPHMFCTPEWIAFTMMCGTEIYDGTNRFRITQISNPSNAVEFTRASSIDFPTCP